ncbi:hypothetical protein KPSA1B_101469 [Pseudomonas syringae pv. actinidiae]|nr:hypothetical protein KPSA1B_101469 [Pseudomonas syringae pv. actinidiae]
MYRFSSWSCSQGLADFAVEYKVDMHRTESYLHTMLNYGMAFGSSGKKIPLREGF